MLVLTRGVGQGIEIGEFVVWVARVDGGQVRLAIDAPKEVPIRRLVPEKDGRPFQPRHNQGGAHER